MQMRRDKRTGFLIAAGFAAVATIWVAVEASRWVLLDCPDRLPSGTTMCRPMDVPLHPALQPYVHVIVGLGVVVASALLVLGLLQERG